MLLARPVFRATPQKTDDQALIRFVPETVVERDQSYELRDGSVI